MGLKGFLTCRFMKVVGRFERKMCLAPTVNGGVNGEKFCDECEKMALLEEEQARAYLEAPVEQEVVVDDGPNWRNGHYVGEPIWPQ